MNKTLPDKSEPLKLADGTIIDPSTGRPETSAPLFVEIPNGQRAQEIVGNTRRRMVDLPEPPKTMNAISVVMAYTMYGLSPQEIAIGTGLSAEQIVEIRAMPAYKELERGIVESVIEADSENVRTMLQKASINAAARISTLLGSQSEDIQLAAARDVLNRTGHGSKDDSGGGMNTGLNINIVVKDETARKPIIEIEG